ncbi:MAG: tRNA uridine-5-carboxymethylaminomethyl(34) synthesis GTPase MnmE [Candidatus Auribacter fodinae]|jgi:tRNA modification GTPase|uniref:tRNA modification GTPase MnmE n=1 Tax=Candidatus Auribacter fodinae TaxID=2093366 RepID=A0A3A4R7N1_9BACT|nr:MAG: tRNA uridine-5-carboxymethylaminomethyl(34) synthesis GTPase MnmE [Candidatus Auribacter fodinae]
MWNDTIIARSTPDGIGAIGIIRITGSDTHHIARRIISSYPDSDRLVPRKLYMGQLKNSRQELLDEITFIPYIAPRSYTGEDILEIFCHGNNILINCIISFFIDQGARLALPGEFTRRSFMNGKMDLTQAESVAELISAETEQQLKTAAAMLSGAFGEKIHALRQNLILLISWVEASIDFPEEDDAVSVRRPELLQKLEDVTAQVRMLKDSYQEGKLIREGMTVTIAGDTNVGKSSLMNALFEEEKSIVTPIHGTTRDIVEGSLRIGGMKMVIRDTAGLRAPEGLIEEEGIRRARKSIDQADVVLYVVSAEREEIPTEREFLASLQKQGKFCVAVVNKTDIRPVEHIRWAKELNCTVCFTSALNHSGIEEVKNALKQAAYKEIDKSHQYEFTVNQRQFLSLSCGLDALERTKKALEDNLSEEFVVEHLKEASASLAEIIGEVSAEHILDTIFEQFCIGK